MSLNHSRAQADLQEGVGVVAAVKHLAVPVDVAEKLQHKLEGPADTGGGGCAHEQVAAVDGEDCVSESEDADLGQNAAIADPEFPEEALPAMSFCADSLAGGDLDELQAIRRVHADLEKLQETVRSEAEAASSGGHRRRRLLKNLRQSTQAMLDSSLADKIVKHNEALDQLDNQGVAQEAMGVNAFVQGTASKPMSMYWPELWAMCFPDKFPYGDGVLWHLSSGSSNLPAMRRHAPAAGRVVLPSHRTYVCSCRSLACYRGAQSACGVMF